MHGDKPSKQLELCDIRSIHSHIHLHACKKPALETARHSECTSRMFPSPFTYCMCSPRYSIWLQYSRSSASCQRMHAGRQEFECRCREGENAHYMYHSDVYVQAGSIRDNEAIHSIYKVRPALSQRAIVLRRPSQECVPNQPVDHPQTSTTNHVDHTVATSTSRITRILAQLSTSTNLDPNEQICLRTIIVYSSLLHQH